MQTPAACWPVFRLSSWGPAKKTSRAHSFWPAAQFLLLCWYAAALAPSERESESLALSEQQRVKGCWWALWDQMPNGHFVRRTSVRKAR
jgi:hypothetical protein